MREQGTVQNVKSEECRVRETENGEKRAGCRAVCLRIGQRLEREGEGLVRDGFCFSSAQMVKVVDTEQTLYL